MDNKLLKQFESFLSNVSTIITNMEWLMRPLRQHYRMRYEIPQHAGRIYEVLTSSDMDDAVPQYNETAPNKFMKTFIAMCYLVQRFRQGYGQNRFF